MKSILQEKLKRHDKADTVKVCAKYQSINKPLLNF